jgi:carbon monoxide dehydrogenase subunit G
MKLSGSVEIAAAREALWAALNNPDVLARCIDGVEQLVRTDGEVPTFDGTLNAKVGPVRAKFGGQVRLENIVAPERYRLVGEGKGGVAGFAKGGADVVLTVLEPARTRLDYDVDAQVGGKLAQLGARLIEGTAKQYADNFFNALKAEVEGKGALSAPDPVAAPEPVAAPAPASGGLSPLVWGGALLLLVLLFLGWQWLA